MRMRRVSIRLPSEIVDDLRQEAKATKCGVSLVMRRRLESEDSARPMRGVEGGYPVGEIEVDSYPVKEGLDGLTVEVHHGLASLSSAVRNTFTSSAEADSNMENANVVDGLFAIANAIETLADRVGDILAPKRKESAQ